MNDSEMKITSGTRLKECMKRKNITLSGLSGWIATNKGMDYSEQYISQMRNDHRPISAQNAFMFAECLGVEADYLLGKDGFSVLSYEDFLDLTKQKKRLADDRAELHKYDHYLNACGYMVIEGTFLPDGTISQYRISNKKRQALIPDKEMKRFQKCVDEFIRLKMDALMDKNEE